MKNYLISALINLAALAGGSAIMATRSYGLVDFSEAWGSFFIIYAYFGTPVLILNFVLFGTLLNIKDKK